MGCYPTSVERAYPHYRRLDLDTLLPYFKFMPELDITVQLSRIQAQTLVGGGDRDPIVPPEQSHQLAWLINDAEVAIIKDAGHLPFLERPIDYNVSVSRWLACTKLSA